MRVQSTKSCFYGTEEQLRYFKDRQPAMIPVRMREVRRPEEEGGEHVAT